MSSVIIAGDTSGTVTLQAPAAAGSTVINLPAVNGTAVVNSNATNVLAEAQGGTGTTTGYYGFKNRIINGAMMIDQRKAGASVTASTVGAFTYTLDRFAYAASQASKFTIQQNAGSVSLPAGFVSYLGATVGAAANVTVGANDYFSLNQIIEGFNISDLGWGTANAQSVTLTFKVYSSLTGTFGGVLSNNTGYSYPFTYSISSANTWTTISVTVTGPTSGTWLANNGTGIRVIWDLGTGSSGRGTAGAWASTAYIGATGATNWISTNSATFYITGVQLEKGSTATSFDYRPYGTELQLCQRYYVNAPVFTFVYNAGAYSGVQFPVTMRAAPTVTATPSSGTVSNYAISTMGFTSTNTTLANAAYVASSEL